MDADDRHDIMEVKVFVDSKGHEVRKFSQVFGKNRVVDFYHGIAAVRVRMRAPNGQDMVQERPVEFPFADGTGLKTAFETFDDVAKKFIDDMMVKERERAAANRIVPAAAMPKVLGPNGKPMGG